MMKEGSKKAQRYSKIVQTGLAFAMGLAIAVGATACRPATNPNTPNDPDHTVTDPSGNGNNNTDSTDPYSQYSQILQNVLKSDYYNGLIDSAKQNPNSFYTPEYDSHPYSFLQKQGHDVEKVKSGELDCKTTTFIKDEEPNNLYIITYVENEGAFPYYTEYLLKAELTDQEIKDYKMLHSSSNLYIQSIFMNDQICKSKSISIVSECNISVEAQEGLHDFVCQQPAINGNISSSAHFADCILQNVSKQDKKFTILVYEKAQSSIATRSSHLGTLTLSEDTASITVENNIFTGPYKDGKFRVGYNGLPDFQASLESITVFNTQDVPYGNFHNFKQ